MNLREKELELAWLTTKIVHDRERLTRFQTYTDQNEHQWSRGTAASVFKTIRQMETDLYYAEHQLEQLAWDVVQAREIRDADRRVSSRIPPLR